MIDKDIIFPKIIIGSRGCGKTQHMYDLIDDQIKREPNKKIVIIRTTGINPYYGFFKNK